MLIGVELPITEENVENIDAFNLVKAHEMFIQNVIAEKQSGSMLITESMKQFAVCKNEITRRLQDLERREEQDEYDYWEYRNSQD